MKKFMLACALIAAASLSQAASLNWTMTNVKTAVANGDGTFSNGENATGYLVLLFASAQGGDYGKASMTVDSVVTALKAGKLSTSDAITTGSTQIGMSKPTGYNGNNYGAGDSLTGFALVLNAGSIAEASAYITTAEKSVSWGSTVGAQTLVFGSLANSTWTALSTTPSVPEPATGALALAGLALLFKRRRA